MSTTRFYKIWFDMKRRCNDPSRESYANYGARGVTVCNKWEDFLAFKEDMFESYNNHVKQYGENDTTLDRIDVNGNYDPSNCQWATRLVQGRYNRARRTSKTGVAGVTTLPSGSYQVTLRAGDLRLYLGSYKTLEEATEVRGKAELKYWGVK